MFLPFGVAVLVVAGAAWWIATSLLTNALEQRLTDQLSRTAEVMAAGAFPFTPELLRQVGQMQDAWFLMIRHDGSAGVASGELDAVVLAAALDAWGDHGRDAAGSTRKLDVAGATYEVVVRPFAEGRDAQYAAVIGMASLADVHAAARQAGLGLGGLSLLAFALLTWWGHRMSRRLEVAERKSAESARLAGLGELARRVAHEIRNPLTAIKLQIQLLAEGLSAPADQTTTTQLLDEVERLDLVVANTLTLGGPVTLDRKPTDLNALVGQVATLMMPQLRHRRVSLEQRPGAFSELMLDAARVKQVVFNLLTNAAEAQDEGGRIRITTEQGGTPGWVEVSVEDDGPGLSDAVESQLFDGVFSDKRFGSGIGLLISKEIIELHGGKIRADASPELGGARFTITLPTEPQD